MLDNLKMVANIVWNNGPKKAKELIETPVKQALVKDQAAISRAAREAVKKTVRVAESANLHIDGKESFKAMEKLISDAKQTIQFEMFTFKDDETGKRISDLLIKKRNDGVDVKLLLDTYGTASNMDDAPHMALYKRMRENGVDVRLHNPEVFTVAEGMPLTHRKMIIADGERFMTGGMNISDRYAKEWHDTMMTVEGPATRDAISAFNRNWTRTGADAIPLPHYPAGVAPKAKVVLNDPQDDFMQLTETFLSEIGNAKKSVKVMMPYLSDEPFIDALSQARARGVQVDVMLPRLNDEKVYVDLNNHFAEDLLENGINVRWYEGKKTPDLPQEHFSHTKLIVIDDQKSIIGSANADTRAFEANHELSVIVDDAAFAKDVNKRLWEPDWNASPKASLAALDDVGVGEKLKREAWGVIAPLI